MALIVITFCNIAALRGVLTVCCSLGIVCRILFSTCNQNIAGEMSARHSFAYVLFGYFRLGARFDYRQADRQPCSRLIKSYQLADIAIKSIKHADLDLSPVN
ncbi:hypothetical protein F4811DRAFT_512938 [Daldinia bambusicola]|nr:hypothetical protein F4811DRAFT_512938 [Daldinia bambusicola]